MNVKNSDVDFVSAPANFADFYAQYHDFVVLLLITKAGIDPQNAEDVAHDILLRFMERDLLSAFDPTLVFMYEGEPRPARFKSFLSKIVMTYAHGHRDRQARLRNRELQMVDIPAREDGNLWLDVFCLPEIPDEEKVLDSVSEQQLVTWLRNYLAGVPRRSVHDRCDLVELWDQVMVQIRRDGEYNLTQLRKIFGVSSTAIHSWMWWLRLNLAAALDRPLPPRRERNPRAES